MGGALRKVGGIIIPLQSNSTSTSSSSSRINESGVGENEDYFYFHEDSSSSSLEDDQIGKKFPDLSFLPPELALEVLSHLNATDLSLAGCVWQQFASDEILWNGLCHREWPQASIYKTGFPNPKGLSARKIYLLLDEATLTFNSNPKEGMQYFFNQGLLNDDPQDIAAFFHNTSKLDKACVRMYLQTRPEIASMMVQLQNFSRESLPNALRKFFNKMEAPPNDRGSYLHKLLDGFSQRFVQCNPSLGYSPDFVYVLCFSLILLSVDLCSPHVKNKMSKREFIRNTRNAVELNNDDLYGEMYDNVFLRGHISCGFSQRQNLQQNEFIPGYLALFL